MTIPSDLLDLFHSIPSAEEHAGVYNAVALPGGTCHRLAKTHEGAPVLLLKLDQDRANTPLGIKLAHLQVTHRVRCAIHEPSGQVETGDFTVLECRGGDTVIHEYFLRVLCPHLARLSEDAPPSLVTEAVAQLVELFRAMGKPAAKSVHGLWGELFVITESGKPHQLIKAWRGDTDDVFDFASDSIRMDVKSSAERDRRHYFSLSQLTPPVGTEAIVASVFVESLGSGVSIADLLDRLIREVGSDPELIQHLDRNVAECLGSDWRLAIEERFDIALAKDSLRFFSATDIPAVSRDLPAGVSDVRFRSDLTRCQALEPGNSERLASLGFP